MKLFLFVSIQIFVICVTWMVPNAVTGGKVEVINLPFVGFAWFPMLRKRGLQTFASDPKELLFLLDIHSEPAGIFENFILSRLIIFRKFLLEYNAVSCRHAETSAA